MKQFHTIFDRVAKRCLSLSPKTTIRLIHGLYGTDYPLDSPVEYNWTEHTSDDLRRTLADTIITVGTVKSYHVEFQMSEDGDLILRMFEYGHRHAVTKRGGKMELHFPNPLILYLYEDCRAPDTLELPVIFGDQGSFTYRVPVIRYQELSREELARRNLLALVPFQLLKLRKRIQKERSAENIEALKSLITDDIIGSINNGLTEEVITASEGQKLKLMALQIYRRLFSKYKEEGSMKEIDDMTEEAMILEIDIIEQRHRRELENSERKFQAMKLMFKGLPDQEISEQTGFSLAELEELRGA